MLSLSKHSAQVCENALLAYLRQYQDGGVERLKEIHFYSPKSELAQYTQTIEDYFLKNPPATINEAVAKIEELTGIRRSREQVRIFLKGLGLSPHKVGMIPAKADVQVQEKFLQEQLQPRIEQARAGKRVIFFVDAVHTSTSSVHRFVLAPFLGILWTLSRLFVRAPAGRQRFNVLGALNALTHKLIMVNNDSYINAQSVCELLLKIADASTGIPITVVLDNARYQHCKKVQEYAVTLGIELLFLPPYSPNLNIIERVWKFVKRKCLYSKYYEKFPEFKAAITDCLENMGTKYKQELDTLLTLNFQTFKVVHLVGG